MQTTTAIKAGNAPDLLSGILSVQVRNEDKITEQDRIYCQNQQDLLYKTLDGLTAGTPSSRRKRNNTVRNVISGTKRTGKLPCVISIPITTTGRISRTTSSNRSISSMIWSIRTVMPIRISQAALSPISTRPIMSPFPCRRLTIKRLQWGSAQSMKPTWMRS